VENGIFAKERDPKNFPSWHFLSCLIFLFFLLNGCASSNVTREASANVDRGFRNAHNMYEGTSGTHLADTYQNSSQRTKGFVLGGAAGATIGFATSGVGIVPGAAIGAIIGSSYGRYIDQNTTLYDQLENRGASLVVLGDQVLIVVPSARIFEPFTATIKPQAYSTLNLITCYLNQFTKMLVKISVYTECTGEVDGPLSQEQANKLARMFVAFGVDARLIYAVGGDGTHLVVRNASGWDSDNYRIEITLEKLYV
jgi:outer membrane protein OmpA-like peptidoglycan-associated protein